MSTYKPVAASFDQVSRSQPQQLAGADATVCKQPDDDLAPLGPRGILQPVDLWKTSPTADTGMMTGRV